MTTMRTDVAVHQAPATKHAQSQKGNALVEFALILPIFLMLIFGMITFSLALYNKTVLTMATREGARAGAKYVANRTNTLIKSNATTAVTNACRNNLISFGAAMTPAITFNADPTSDKILTVKARVNYTGLYIFSIIIPISAQTSMRIE
jgi:Flp pilus assembly protein TadG